MRTSAGRLTQVSPAETTGTETPEISNVETLEPSPVVAMSVAVANEWFPPREIRTSFPVRTWSKKNPVPICSESATRVRAGAVNAPVLKVRMNWLFPIRKFVAPTRLM